MKKQLLMLAAFTVAATVASHASLVAHYTFDVDGTATVGMDATLGDAASITATSKVGAGALALSGAPTVDGSGDDGAVGGDTYAWTTAGSDVRTVAFWMKAASGDTGDSLATMISLGSTTVGGARFDIRLDGENLRLEVQAGGSTSGSDVVDGGWHHIAVVVPNVVSTVNNVTYWIDGTQAGTFVNAQSINTGDGPLRMGDSFQDVGRDFKGSLDDVRLYDHALNSTEIAALAIPEPTVIGLLSLTGIALILRRRFSIG